MSDTTLVIGATGNVGSRLIPLLTARGRRVRAASRQPETISDPQVETVRFDYDDPATYTAAVEGVQSAFVIAKSADPEAERTLLPFFQAARAAGVEHVVLMTALGIEHDESIPLRKVERGLEASGLAHTILRPNWFMQNFTPGFLQPMIEAGTIYLPAGEARTSFIDAGDIAAVAAAALTEPGHGGRTYALTGPEALTYGEAAAILSEATGREIAYVPISDDAFRDGLLAIGWASGQIEVLVGLFAAARTTGYAAVVTPDIAEVTGREPVSLRVFAAQALESVEKTD